MINISTSYNEKQIKFQMSNNEIYFVKVPTSSIFNDVLILIFDTNKKEVYRQCTNKFLQYRVSLKTLKDGIYFLGIYVKSSKDTLYHSYIGNRDIAISIKKGVPSFLKSKVYYSNYKFIVNLDLEEYRVKELSSTYSIQTHNINIRNLALSLSKNISDKMEIVKNIHRWVAENLSYYQDSLVNNDYIEMDNTALGAYVGRKCVCQGFSNLTVALLRSLGIPSHVVSCFTLGKIEEGGWEIQSNLSAEANHVIPVAKVNERWVIMDPTWDSKGEYVNAQFKNSSGYSFPYKYFDNTVDFISNTHRFVSVL